MWSVATTENQCSGAKFVQHLATSSARGSGLLSCSVDRNRLDLFVTGGNGSKNCGAFGAVAQAERGVFHIAPGVYFPGGRQYRGADGKL